MEAYTSDWMGEWDGGRGNKMPEGETKRLGIAPKMAQTQKEAADRNDRLLSAKG